MSNLNYNKGLIIDSNLLILLITGYYDKNYIKSFKRTSLYSVEDFNVLKKIVDKFSKIIITPHILTEISNLCIDQKGDDSIKNKKFREFLITFIRTIYSFKEIHIAKNQILVLEYFHYLGVTDSAIIEIAIKNKLNVITDDAGVYVKLYYLNVPVINLTHLRKIT